ncbi:plasmid replication protein RepC [Cognatishimia maritima]|uniref:Replication initiation protein RepC n=1 Tax=Cognatishimia maritima TaxID=870908 RepID=A0A1M5QFD7_9RHOB|nr:plasmid replication protein RepC [Cognatishimia maritima]SHH12915.1 replication initiation protein RepC [Cognatishimia maritima]
MDYSPVTSFRRPLRAADLAPKPKATVSPLRPAISKWDVLQELAVARVQFGLTDRDLTVLQAMLSFHKGTMLDLAAGELVVFPSNKTICHRLNGMPCSTMRRHLAKLVSAGLLIRRDSPNGKRYLRTRGAQRVAFGFDLSPLVTRYVEICEAAEAARATEETIRTLRESVSLMRRDLAALADLGAELQPQAGLWDALSDQALLTARTLRRKLDIDALKALELELAAALKQAEFALSDAAETNEMSTSDDQNEQHQYSSKIDKSESRTTSDFEPTASSNIRHADRPDHRQREGKEARSAPQNPPPAISIDRVQELCSEMQDFANHPIRCWNELLHAAENVRPMMGLSEDVWRHAKSTMGAENAAVVLAVMLRDFQSYSSPGGYLRTLAQKAGQGAFDLSRLINIRQVRAA